MKDRCFAKKKGNRNASDYLRCFQNEPIVTAAKLLLCPPSVASRFAHFQLHNNEQKINNDIGIAHHLDLNNIMSANLSMNIDQYPNLPALWVHPWFQMMTDMGCFAPVTQIQILDA